MHSFSHRRTLMSFALATSVLSLGATAALLPATAGAARLSSVSRAVPVGTDWPAYGRNPDHSSAIFGDPAITATNAGALKPVWHFVAQAATQPNQPARRFDASPTVVGGRVYIGSATGMFYVLNASTGAVVWKKQLDFGSSQYCAARGITGTATVTTDPVDGVLTVYAPGAHYLYALNAATGAQRWRRSIGPDTTAGNGLYYNWASPTVFGGRVFMGLAANCEPPLIRGGVVSINQHTGALEHTWYAVPAGKVGASVWSSEAASGNDVWVTTGNPDPTGTTIDDSYSIVRLAAGTLAKLSKWTVPNKQAADYDFGSSPTRFTAVLGGTATPLIGACNKDGIYYAWRQSDLAAGPVWAHRVATPGSTTNGSCITPAAWDFQALRLFVAANATTIGGVQSPGGLRALNPTTGAVIWERPLPCLPTGGPTINSRVVAVPMFRCPTGITPSVKLFRESDGQPLGSVAAPGRVFAQPVMAAGKLFVASEDGTLTAYSP
jgi:polyvinyl alcohol dehydrogenase (cytochrome)